MGIVGPGNRSQQVIRAVKLSVQVVEPSIRPNAHL